MSFVLVSPETVAAVATDLKRIGANPAGIISTGATHAAGAALAAGAAGTTGAVDAAGNGVAALAADAAGPASEPGTTG